MPTLLSKSDFKVAQTCPTKLFYKKNRYPSSLDDDDYLELLAEGGFMVEKIAKTLFPDGIEVPFDGNYEKAAQATSALVAADRVTLFEATIVSNGKLARIDILRKAGLEFEIIEAKAKSYDSRENAAAVADGKPNLFWTKNCKSISSEWIEYLEDVAFQVHVLKEAFPAASVKAKLALPDKSKANYIDHLSSLFVLKKIQSPGSSFTRVEVEFTGDAETLRRNNFMEVVLVDREVNYLMAEVAASTAVYVQSLHPNIKRITHPISVSCKDCEYNLAGSTGRDGFAECWGELARLKPHILDLYHVGEVGGRKTPLANSLIKAGKASMFDIPVEALTNAKGEIGENNKRQIIQLDNTRSGKEWISEDLKAALSSFEYPLWFIDFETSALAVPYFSGMYPYEQIAFQWSCHVVRSENAAPEHQEWINVEDLFPNFSFAESLMNFVGTEGTVFMWATHENTILSHIHDQMRRRSHLNPKLNDWIESTATLDKSAPGRLVDMNRLTLKNYFHPLMKGKTSIKKVCDAVWKENANLREMFPQYVKTKNGEILSPYQALPPLIINGREVVVAEGTGAIRAYEAMVYGSERTDEAVKSLWKDLLRQYCKLDTLSMFFVWKHWRDRLALR